MRVDGFGRHARVLGLAMILPLLALPLLAGCGTEVEKEEPQARAEDWREDTEPKTAPTLPEPQESGNVRLAIAEYLATMAGDMTAAELQTAIAGGDGPYIVSLRSAADYAAGHIAGAVNVAFADLATLPMDEKIVVYSSTGQLASFAAAVLGVLHYDVSNLVHGMSGWSADSAVYKTRFNAATDQADFEVETASHAGGAFSMPHIDNTPSRVEEVIVEAAALTATPLYISATDLNQKIADGEAMTVISLRSAEHYAAGHIPGAINIVLPELGHVASLNKIDTDAPVYVYSYTGQSGAQGAALLQMLGYDAYSVSFGMCGWTSDAAINMGECLTAASVPGLDTEN